MVSALFLLLSAAVQGIFGSVPVLIWGGKNGVDYPLTPALKKVSTDEFSDLIKEIVFDKSPSKVVVFIQESLSPEDLGWRDVNEKSAYPNIANEFTHDVPTKYLPYVENPLDGLKSLGDHGFQITEFNDEKVTVDESSKNLFILKLNESDNIGDRISLLRNHDNLIHETCSKIKKIDDGAVCILTGIHSSWVEPNLMSSRHLLQTTDSTPQGPDFFKAENYGLFYTNQPPLLEDLNTNTSYFVVFDKKINATGGNDFSTQQKLSVSANINKTDGRIKLKFTFTVSNSTLDWHLDNITLTIPYTSSNPVILNSTSDVSGRFRYSYHTPSPVVFSSPEYRLTFYSLQIELFNGYDSNSFSAAEDTVGFFTIPIWSGLFVTSLLVTIVLIGLSLIYDIKTMDQFDDPKGKPLTINASE